MSSKRGRGWTDFDDILTNLRSKYQLAALDDDDMAKQSLSDHFDAS